MAHTGCGEFVPAPFFVRRTMRGYGGRQAPTPIGSHQRLITIHAVEIGPRVAPAPRWAGPAAARYRTYGELTQGCAAAFFILARRSRHAALGRGQLGQDRDTEQLLPGRLALRP